VHQFGIIKKCFYTVDARYKHEDVILDFGEKYLKMKQDEVIRRHEFFYNTVPKTGNEIKLIAKLNQLT
jgi:hypothetical protein